MPVEKILQRRWGRMSMRRNSTTSRRRISCHEKNTSISCKKCPINQTTEEKVLRKKLHKAMLRLV
jgi:hypothetical protein